MSSKRARAWLFAAGLLMGGLPLAGTTAEALELQSPGRLRVAVYANFPPYSDQGKGIDIALGRELARRMGLEAEVVEYNADEDMNDDLRNMVWKGHYLGTRPSDVMLHVPVDPHLAKSNEQVKIFGPYHLESVAIARNTQRVPPVAGSAARALEVFTREKIGVENASLADGFLLSVLNGRLRDNVVHFRTLDAAAAALKEGQVAAIMGTRGEVEGAVGKNSGFEITTVNLPELQVKVWALGMAVKADNIQLADALSKTMKDIQTDGTVERIFADYGITLQKP